MAEPGTSATDLPAIFDKLRQLKETFDSRSKGIEQSLADLRATLQASEPTSSERRTGRSSARRKARPPPARSRADDIISLLNRTSKAFAFFVNETRKDFAALTNETREKVNTLAKRIHTSSQVSQGPQARAEQGASTHQHREAESEDQALGNAHCDNSATSIKASRDVSSDSCSKDAPMRDYDEAQPSPSGSTATIAATASASQSAPRQATVADSRPDLCASSDHQHGAPAINPTPDSQSDGSIDQNPTTPGKQEREPGGRDSDTLMTDAEQPTCGRQDLAKRAAGTTAVTLPQAHEGEGGPRPIVVNDQPAKSPGPEDGTDRLVSMSTPDRHTTTPLLIPDPASRGPPPNDSTAAEEQPLGETVSSRGDTASSQVSTPSPSSGTTPQGSDTTEDTSRVSTPDTHLTSPDTSVLGSTPKLTLSEADMGERLVEALGRIKRDDSMHKISAPNLPIDLDLLKAEFSAPNHDCQYAANTFVPGPEREGYTNVHISERRSDFAWPDFSDEVAIPTKEEARKWLDDFCNNPPEKTIPYFSGHLHIPAYERLLNPGPAILGNPKLADLHRPYWHIGGDRSANRFHIEDYNCSEDERPCGLRSANLVFKGVKVWIGIKRHHTKKFEAFIAKNWACNGCSQRVGHQSLLIAPWRLEREGIDFVIEVQGPMELVDPGYGLYHGIVNMGSCIAMSMNYMLPGDRLKSTALRQCGDCGVPDDTVVHVPSHKQPKARKLLPSSPPYEQSVSQPLVSELRRSHKRPAMKQAGPRRNTRACTQENKELGVEINAAKKADPLCSIPTVDRNNLPPLQTEVLVRAASIRSKVAVDQLVVLTRELTQQCSNLPEPEDSIDRQIIALKQGIGKSALSKFRVRLAQARLARVVDDEKESLGRRCASHTDLKSRAEHYGVDHIHFHLQQGRQWIKLCGPHEGLLPLILLSPWSRTFNVTSRGWEELIQVRNAEKLEAFHKLLDDPLTQDLDAAGRIFLGILDGGQKAVGWELALNGAEQAEDLDLALKSYMKLRQTSS
ncbi:hypothetical protein CEP52_014763 [Fusarium oligoseptatum]|uniref:JmjC domain-containing protein n=1 Tax=Fusarium oligoseptatum TaxID=2604345 RepID=A0A428SJB3_9HYPO|nr:hypothetical protein CEP52_014763 [Fusarium oligoseptatum]